MKIRTSIGFLLAGLVLLPGCMHVPTYKCVPLKSIGDNCTYRAIHQNLVVRAKLLNTAERYALLKERVQSLYEHDIIYLSVHNLSDRAYVISSKSVDLEQIKSGEIATLIKHTSSGSRLTGSAFAGLYAGVGVRTFIQENATAGGIGAVGYVLFPVIIGFSVVSLVMGIQGIKSVVMNRRVSNDLADKTLNKVVVINSGDQHESLLFIKSSSYRSLFSVTLHEKDTVNNVINFDIDLRKPRALEDQYEN